MSDFTDAPFERRPLTEEARAGSRSPRRAKVLLGASGTEVDVETHIAPSLSPSARRYAANEEKWQLHLMRVKARAMKDGRRSGRDALELAVAKRARLKRSDAYIDGQDDTPLGAYTQLEVDAYGARGMAFKKRDGTFGFVILNRRDLLNALAAWRQLPLTSARARTEALEVKSWIKERAIHLKLEELLPANWQLKVPDAIGDSAAPHG
jgi:hypothetical protein